MKPKPKDIDEYIGGFPSDTQKILKSIRATIRYGIPSFKLNGKRIYFAGFKAHIGLYPVTPDVKEKFKKELSRYEGGRGTVRFPLDQPIQYSLIGKIVKFKVRQIAH